MDQLLVCHLSSTADGGTMDAADVPVIGHFYIFWGCLRRLSISLWSCDMTVSPLIYDCLADLSPADAIYVQL